MKDIAFEINEMVQHSTSNTEETLAAMRELSRYGYIEMEEKGNE